MRVWTWLAVVVAVCFTAGTVQAAMLSFTVPISVSQETGAVDLTGVAFPGFEPVGIGNFTYDTATDELTWDVVYVGLTGPLTAAHIHGPAAPGVNAGILVPLSMGGPATGSFSGSSVEDDTFESLLLSDMLYINLHTAQNPAGEIRGQITPEPASLALTAMGFSLLLRRRRTA